MENDLIQNAAKDSNKMLNRKMKILLDIGQTLMENGADCARIVRDMTRAAVHLCIPTAQIQSRRSCSASATASAPSHSFANA